MSTIQTTKVRHFLTLMDFSKQELSQLIQRAIELKQAWKQGDHYEPMRNQTLAMIFEKSSTRTRVSFETGMTQLGGHAMFLSPNDTQLGRGEPVEDAARVISRMVDVVMIRTYAHETVEKFAAYSKVPVINALTDSYHPCQLLADMMTYKEHKGSIQGKTVAWIGDGNNMCHSYMQAASVFGFILNIATPKGYEPEQAFIDKYQDCINLSTDASAACKDADLVVTDVWASMGQEAEQTKRELAFTDFQVDEALMKNTKADASFMHCLPAHRGEEVSAEVIDGAQSLVWDEAENRLHAQKALLLFLLKP
jgi:ornithine carbamoyltransferase